MYYLCHQLFCLMEMHCILWFKHVNNLISNKNVNITSVSFSSRVWPGSKWFTESFRQEHQVWNYVMIITPTEWESMAALWMEWESEEIWHNCKDGNE